jgi:hypothetical protein
MRRLHLSEISVSTHNLLDGLALAAMRNDDPSDPSAPSQVPS